MKIGCHASALQPVRKAPYDEAIRNAGKIGFAGVELIAMDRGELYDYYTPPRVKELRALAAANGLEISQFAVYSTACEGMASLDAAEKSDGMKVFEKGIDVCADLGCKIVNLVSHWPVGLKAPIEYPPSYIYPIARGAGRMPTSKVVMEIPQPFDFARIWDNYVDSLSKATSYAAKRGVKLAIEGHAHVIVSGADALLRLFDRLDHPNAVVNFDTSWHFIQREYVPMAIHKLKGKIAHVHMRDADGVLYYGAPVGQGVIDWHGVIRALRDTGFDGFLSFEYSGFEDYVGVASESKAYIERVVRDVLSEARA